MLSDINRDKKVKIKMGFSKTFLIFYRFVLNSAVIFSIFLIHKTNLERIFGSISSENSSFDKMLNSIFLKIYQKVFLKHLKCFLPTFIFLRFNPLHFG